MNSLQVNQTPVSEIEFIARKVASSSFFPCWRGKENDAAVAILFGKSLGLTWGYSLTNIMVVNGRPTIWGDAILALCKQSRVFESCDETFDKKTMTATCVVKRKGEKEQMRTFSREDAERAKLWGKSIWLSYPLRMLQMRARSFALRDVFPDILQGLGCTEEVMDYREEDIVQVPAMTSPAKAEKIFQRFEELGIPVQNILTHYEKESASDFSEEELNNLIETGKAIASGEITCEEAFPIQFLTRSDTLAEEISGKNRN